MTSTRKGGWLLSIVLGAAMGAGCSGPADSPGATNPNNPTRVEFPVEALKAEARLVEYRITAVGSVEAFEEVQVTARVAGAVERVHFSEGAVVEKNKPLVEIEPERYRLAVESARAAVEKAKAAQADAAAGLARREEVDRKNPGLIIGEEIETWRTRVQTAAAERSQAESALKLAELNLRDAYVRAPVSGTVQARNVTTGEYVQPGKVLTTLIRREPLLLRFQVPSEDSGRLALQRTVHLSVQGLEQKFDAVITHIAGSADPLSRMVPVTAHVTDPRRDLLRPGAFAEVQIPVGSTAEAPVIPQTAIRPSERGFVAFVVENDTAKERILSLGMRTADGLVEVRSGIEAGELVVVRGAESLRDGVFVRVAPPAKPGDPGPGTEGRP